MTDNWSSTVPVWFGFFILKKNQDNKTNTLYVFITVSSFKQFKIASGKSIYLIVQDIYCI